MKLAEFIGILKKNGFNFATGVPCSYFSALINIFSRDRYFTHIPAVREDVSAGLCAGAFLSGKLPVIYMQNSGLGYSLEAFASLHLMYRIPTLVLVSYRGPDDPNMEEHEIMGKHTEALLRLFDIQHTIVDGHTRADSLPALKQMLIKTQKPYVLLIKKDAFK